MKASGLAFERDALDHVVGVHAGLVEAPEQRDDLVHRLLIGKPRFLERDADPFPDRDLIGLPLQSQDFHFAGSRLIQTLENLDGRGLARAVGAKQAKALALLDLEVDTAHGMDRAASARVFLAQVLDANRPFAHAPSRLPALIGSIRSVRFRIPVRASMRKTESEISQITVPSASTVDLGITTTPSRITWVELSSDSSGSAFIDRP